ncbi:MoaD/ThiS family protein [Limobrevibacterium gyesilva]|uniref:MoaD/ThiS family protein n=1 Tax=Limobrevibacterium gyesilva TaxID=2991712 RepID=A0AA41YS96_9PROT|nr:MoaD/ThiS family protein [Limobrevibacterium gyesilva]MCW3474537.1 MoaD/ThiS family protein [Limobrevibacterium gyesilva]
MPENAVPLAASSVLVVLPAALVALFPGCPRQATLSAATVSEVIAALNTRWPGMRDRICDSRPAIRRHIHIFVDGERATLQTRLAQGAEVLVMTAISGG